jgi:hypothetical protein
LASVTWTNEAKEVAYNEQQSGSLSPLYPPQKISNPTASSVAIEDYNNEDYNNEDYNNEDYNNEVYNAISEIIAQDPRAQYDGREQSGSFEITFCTLRISFIVQKKTQIFEMEMENNDNDHHDDDQQQHQQQQQKYCALINKIFKDPGDITAQKGSYQHNLALRRKAEKDAHEMGKKKPIWLNPVREGDVHGLFYLRDGQRWKHDNE